MLTNEVLGIGNEYDALMQTKLADLNLRFLQRHELERLFNIPSCKKVISFKPTRMAQVWGEIQVAKSNQLEEKYNNFFSKLKSKFKQSQILANLYGGACLVRISNDSQNLELPLRKEKIKDVSQISYLGPFDRWEIYPDSTLIISNLYEDRYNPSFYCFTSKMGFKKIHKSRILRFRGDYLPPCALEENNYYEQSLLVSFLPAYLRYILALISISNSLRRFNVPVVEKENLQTMKNLELEMEGLSIDQRMQKIMQQLSSAKGLTLDKLSESLIFPTQNNYSNVQETLQMLKEEMIADSGLTKPQFYQEFPSGLAATGESERIQEANDLTNFQDDKWGELINTEVDLISFVFGDSLENTKWTWNNSYFETPSQKQKVKSENAAIDQIYFNMGVLTAEEIRASRFGGIEYGDEIVLNPNNSIVEKTDINDAPSEKVVPEGDLLPDSYYEEELEEIEEIEEDYE